MKPTRVQIGSALGIFLLLLAFGCTASGDKGGEAVTNDGDLYPRAQPPFDLNIPLQVPTGKDTGDSVREALRSLEGVLAVAIQQETRTASLDLEDGASVSVTQLERALRGTGAKLDTERMRVGPTFDLKFTGVRCPDC